MDERDISIAAQVAAKAATEIVVAHINAGQVDNLDQLFDHWFTMEGQRIISTVRTAVAAQQPVTAPPPFPQAPQTPAGAPGAAMQAPQQTNGVAAPSCPNHGTMVPGPGQTKGSGPLWKCNQSRWDRDLKAETGCGYVIWPAERV